MGIEHDPQTRRIDVVRSEVEVRKDERLGEPYLGTAISGGVLVDIYADNREFGPYLPAKLGLGNTGLASEVAVVVRKSGDYSGMFHGAEKILELNGDPEPLAQQMEFISYVATESVRQEQSRFTLHAAGISKNGESALLLGEKGGGKTSVAISMCRDYGWELIGNDIITVGMHDGRVSSYGGDGVFKVRKLGLGAEFIKPGQSTDLDEFDTKVLIRPEDIGVKRSENLPIPIFRVVQIFVNSDSTMELREVKPDRLATTLRLSENLGRYIHGSTSPILDKDQRVVGMIPSVDTNLAQLQRTRFLNHVIEDVGVTRLAGGDCRSIAGYIDRIRT